MHQDQEPTVPKSTATAQGREAATLYEEPGGRKQIHSGLVVVQAIHPMISKTAPCPVLVAYRIAWSSGRVPRKELPPPRLLLLAPPVHAASVSLRPPTSCSALLGVLSRLC